MALNTHAHNRPLDESIYPRSLDSEEGDPVLEEKNFGETSQQLVEELGRPRKSQLSTPSLFDNQFTAYEPLGSNNRNNSDPNHTASYPAAAIANTNRVPTERELVEDPLTSSEINRTEANTPGVQILLQPPEDGSSHGSRRKTESVHSGHSGHSDFTHVTPVEDFGLTVGMEHIREQIRNGQLCPKFSTRMRDDASTRSHQSDRDAALSESTDFKGIGDHLDDRPQIALPQEHPVKNKRIADQLENMVESKPQNEEFLPWDELLAVLHEANVERELAIHFPPGQVRELVSAICQEDPKRSRRIIMAILSSIADVPSIQHFIANDIFDADLPFLKNTSDVSNDAEHREEQPGRRYRTSKELPPTWPPRVGRSFRTEQYRFLVPFFDMPGNHVNFYRINEKGIILPFLLWDQEKEGGYGTVWKAQIHPAHHNWRPSTSTNTSQKIAKDENPIVAVKEIRSNDYEAYKQEVRVLERFSGSQKGHEHLIRLLMAFQHDSKYYLVFPLAEGGNLQHIWERTTKDPYNRCDVIWLLSQSRGITEGLWKIHQHKSWFANGGLAPSLDSDKNRGRHGDIKPQNILAFKTDVEGEYRLVISDFGLTRFHSALSVSNVPLNKIGGLSFTYRAPEFDQSPSTSQAYDMWGLGCLLLELISWFLLGNANGPKAFRILRNRDDEPSPGVLPHISNTVEDKFFNIIDEKAVVKRSVTQWIDKLRGLENCPTSISDLLKEIKTDLLVTTKDTRAKVDVFHANLTEILKTSKERLDYCVPTVRNAGVKKPVEATISAQCDSEESQDETPASRRQSSIIQHIIIRQRDNYRVSLDNSRQTTASLQQALGNVLGSDRVTSPLPQETRLPSPKRSDTTVKANNYKISGHSESNGAYEQQIPRTARVPNLTRNTSTLTETTANPSQDSGMASFSSKATTPPQFSRECTPEQDHEATAVVDNGKGDEIALSVKVNDTGRGKPQHIPSATSILHTVANSLIADQSGLPTVDEQTSRSTLRVDGLPVEHAEEAVDETTTAENSPSHYRAITSEFPTRTRSPTPQSLKTRLAPIVQDSQAQSQHIPHHPDNKSLRMRHSNFTEEVHHHSHDEEPGLVAGSTSNAINEPATKQGRPRKYWNKFQNVMKATRTKLHDTRPRSRGTIPT